MTGAQKRLRLGVAGGIAAAALIAALVSVSSVGARRATAADPATWKPWHLTSASQFRLPAPPTAKSAATKKELAQLLRFQHKRTTQQLKTIKKWNGQDAVLPWTDLLLQAFLNYRPRPPAAAYDLALFYTGMYDAMIAACESRDAYAAKSRPAPSKLSHRLKPIGKPASGSTYAPTEAAMAGAAEILIPYVLPDAPATLYRKAASEAVNSRLWAGLNYRSDVQQARLLGQKVARLVIDQAKNDGRATNTAPPTANPGGDDHWSPTPPGFEPPFGAPAGTWRPWLMTSNGQFLHAIPPPSKYGSPEFMQQVMAVLNQSKTETPAQVNTAYFWDDGAGTVTPPGHWVKIAEGLIRQYHTSNQQALRILALLGPAEADAGVASWYIKYTYWQVRPITVIWRLCGDGTALCTEAQVRANPSIAPYYGKWYSHITTPGFPSYPSGHATFSGAASAVLGYFFPASADKVKSMAEEAAMSRLYGLIHYPEDNAQGLVLGQDVGNLAVERSKTDGAG